MHVDDRDGIGDSAGFLNDGFLGLLDEDFVNYAYYLPGIGTVERAAAITRVCGGVELENIVRRVESGNDSFFQKLSAQLRNDYRSDRGDDSSMCYGVESQYHADWEAGKGVDFSFAHSVGIA